MEATGFSGLIIWTLLTGLVAAALIYGCLFLLRRLRAMAVREARYLLAAFFYSLYWPVVIVIFLAAVSVCVELLDQNSKTSLGAIYAPVFIVGIALAVALFGNLLILRCKQSWLQYSERARNLDNRLRGVVDVSTKAAQALIIGVALLICLRSFGIDVTGILAVGGLGGIILGLAAKDMLSNLFGSIIIYLDQPFAVGDWILCSSEDIEGVVEKISWRSTHVRTFKKRMLYVPNSIFVSNTVENPSRMSHRRIYEHIGVRYQDVHCTSDIIEATRKMLQQHPEIDSSQTIIVNLDAFAPSSLDFFVYAYTRTTDWVRYHAVKQDVLLKIIHIIHKHGGDCAYPTSTVFWHKEEPPPAVA